MRRGMLLVLVLLVTAVSVTAYAAPDVKPACNISWQGLC